MLSRPITCDSDPRCGWIKLTVNNTTELVITVNQEAAEIYYVTVDDATGESAAAHTTYVNLSTNITGTLTFSDYDISMISSVSRYSNIIRIDLREWTDTTQGRDTEIYISYGDCENLASIYVQQDAAEESDYLEFCDTVATTKSIIVPASATSTGVCITTSYNDLGSSGSNIAGVTASTTEISVDFDENTDPYHTVGRSAWVSGGTLLDRKTLTLNITQSKAEPYLTWGDGSTSISESCVVAGDTFIEYVDTNCNYTCSSNVNWITATNSNNQVTVTVSGNTGTSRTGVVSVRTSGITPTELSITLTVTQSAQGYVYLYASGTTTAGSQTIPGQVISSGLTYHLVNNTDVSVSGPDWLTLGTGVMPGGTLVVNYSTSEPYVETSDRYDDIVIDGIPNGGQATYTITQTPITRSITLQCCGGTFSWSYQNQNPSSIDIYGVDFNLYVDGTYVETLDNRGGGTTLNNGNSWTSGDIYGACYAYLNDTAAHTVTVKAVLNFDGNSSETASASFSGSGGGSINNGAAYREYTLANVPLSAGTGSLTLYISGGSINVQGY